MIDLNEGEALLLYGDTERNTDLFYATRFHAPDPFFFVCTRSGRRLLLIGDLELDRARDQADVDEVLSLRQYTDRAEVTEDASRPRAHAGVECLLAELELHSVRVAEDFPVGIADALRAGGLAVRAVPAPLLPQRARKSAVEIEAIRSALAAAESAMDVAIEAIRQAGIGEDGALVLDHEVLTSERLRRLIHRDLLEAECSAQHTIVTCGAQGCDPHAEGSGPLRERAPIIIDIFPRSTVSGYFGDITRTVVKGEATAALRHQFDAVLDAQRGALDSIRAGADSRQIHEAVADLFSRRGFETGERDGRLQGFFHGTGHGLGLDIHESPGIGARPGTLESGHVVTVEPGLYYLEEGGVRIEDVVVVRDADCDNLTTYPKFLEV